MERYCARPSGSQASRRNEGVILLELWWRLVDELKQKALMQGRSSTDICDTQFKLPSVT